MNFHVIMLFNFDDLPDIMVYIFEKRREGGFKVDCNKKKKRKTPTPR